jgi:hypothetical protein
MSTPRLVSSPYERLPLEVREFLENCASLDLENEPWDPPPWYHSQIDLVRVIN